MEVGNVYHGEDRVPIPPKGAEQFTTVCSYCIVGCGYRVYRWPLGKEGGPRPDENAMGADFSRQQRELSGKWISPAMHNVITDRDGKQYNVAIVPDHECVVNKGDHSVRGGTHGDVLYAPDRPTADRLAHPLIYRGNDYLPTTWEEAIELGAKVIKAVLDRWGPDGIAMKFFDHGGGGGGFENNWAVGKLFFTGVGTQMASIHNRPAYNSEVFASADAGVAALPSAYLDAELADTIMIIGANPYETQSVYFLEHMLPNLRGDTLELKKQELPGEAVEAGKMIIVDPRRTSTVAIAEDAAGKDNVLHLQLNGGTDIVLLNAVARVIYERGWQDQAFIDGRTETDTFEVYKQRSLKVGRANLDQVLGEAVALTGVSKDQIVKAAEWIAKPKAGGHRRRTLVLYEKGLIWGLKNYENIAAAVDLALLTGNLGKPGTGCGRLGGHQEGYTRPPYPGKRPPLNVDEVGIKGGKSYVFWVGGCNPAGTTLNAQQLRIALDRRGRLVRDAMDDAVGATIQEKVLRIMGALEKGGLFLIAQDIYPTDTMRYAHLVFPAAQWGETNLTSINGERRLRLYQKFMDPPGIAKPDWEIMALVARKLHELYRAEGNQRMADRFAGFDWKTDEEVFLEGARGTAGAQEDYRGVTYEILRKLGTNGVQTPVKQIAQGMPVGTVRLYEDGRFYTKSGKAKFIPAEWPGYPPAIRRLMDDPQYPFWVNNGRLNHGWQTLYDDVRKPYVSQRVPMPLVEVHPVDAQRLGLESGDLALLHNPYGNVTALVHVIDTVRQGNLFMLFAHPRGWLNSLTTDYVDPDTTIPAYKVTRAGIRKIGVMRELKEALTFLPHNKV